MIWLMIILQETSASSLFSKSQDEAQHPLSDKSVESGSHVIGDESYLGDADDWKLPVDVEGKTAELLRQRGLCVNQLDITSSVTDLDWSVVSWLLCVTVVG